jgi:hypothetical protein
VASLAMTGGDFAERRAGWNSVQQAFVGVADDRMRTISLGRPYVFTTTNLKVSREIETSI